MEHLCQSCGMPMDGQPALRGSNADGSQNAEYCKYCYEHGRFTSDCTMQEMVERCVPFTAQAVSGMSQEQARGMLQGLLPTLKRWRTT